MRYLVRYGGEIATKARPTRRRFQTRLANNIRAALQVEGLDGTVEERWSRTYVTAGAPAADVLSRVYGIQSYSPVETRGVASLGDVVDHGRSLFEDEIAGVKFAVRARLARGVGPELPFGARDVERALGAALLDASDGVDLSAPDVTAHVEIRDGTAYYYTLVLPGPGGLPLGTQHAAVALVSGGFDSAVAAWTVMRRGVSVDYVLCDLGGPEHLATALPVIEHLAGRWSYGAPPRLHVVDFAEVVLELKRKVKPRFLQVHLKRQMLRAADAIAAEGEAVAIVTGDAIGQVASQTLRNLQAMAGAAERPVLRPLLGMDKHEIIARADAIGTGPLSARVEEHCAIVPRNPATAARLPLIREEEALLEPEVLAAAVRERRVESLASGPAPGPALEIDHVPAGARVVDVRSAAAYASWHYPEAEHVALEDAAHALAAFDEQRTVVAYCSFGAKSAMLAQALRRRGVEAWTFKGGTRGLIQWAARRGEVDPLALEVM